MKLGLPAIKTNSLHAELFFIPAAFLKALYHTLKALQLHFIKASHPFI